MSDLDKELQELEQSIDEQVEGVNFENPASVQATEILKNRLEARNLFVRFTTEAKISKKIGDEQGAANSFKNAKDQRKRIEACDAVANDIGGEVLSFYNIFKLQAQEGLQQLEHNTLVKGGKNA